MPNARFKVDVSVNEGARDTRSMAVANVVRYLAYADTTDLFGYHGRVEKLDGHKSARPGNYHTITITFIAPVAGADDIRGFLDECHQLSRVDTVKCVSNPDI